MTTEEIKKVIEGTVPDSVVYVFDPNHDGEHFQAIVISHLFERMALLKQHQLVMKALSQAFVQSVHALSLKTFTPEKWEAVKGHYGI